MLEEINNYATETTHRSEYWPQSAAQLSNRLARVTPPLIAKGCIVERRHSIERKEIIIQPSYNYGDSDQMIPPRGMSKKQAAAYAGCETLSAFNDWIRRGIMPGPIPGTHKWDRKAIDAALDRLSGLQPTIEPQLSPYDEWKVSENADTAQGHQQFNQKAR